MCLRGKIMRLDPFSESITEKSLFQNFNKMFSFFGKLSSLSFGKGTGLGKPGWTETADSVVLQAFGRSQHRGATTMPWPCQGGMNPGDAKQMDR